MRESERLLQGLEESVCGAGGRLGGDGEVSGSAEFSRLGGKVVLLRLDREVRQVGLRTDLDVVGRLLVKGAVGGRRGYQPGNAPIP